MKVLSKALLISLLFCGTSAYAEDVTLAGYITNHTNKALKLQKQPRNAKFPTSLHVDMEWPEEFQTYLVDLPYSRITEEDRYTAPIVYTAKGSDGKEYGCKFAFSYGAQIKSKPLGWDDDAVHCEPGVTIVISGHIP